MSRWPDLHTPIIELRGVSKSFGETHVLRKLDLQIMPRRSTVVMGESGSGKSVLIKLMSGLMLPDEGQVLLFGKDTQQVKRDELMELRRRVGTMFQNYALFDSMTVLENVAFPLVEHTRLSRSEILTQAQELLAFLNLPDAGGLFPSELSGGMKKRVSLARALISKPEVVLFDEPTTGLDPIMIEFVDDMLIKARQEFELTSVYISHDMASAFSLADQMAMLHDGQIVFEGTPEEVRQTEQSVVRNFLDAGYSRLDSTAQEEKETDIEGLSFEELKAPKEEPVVEIRDLCKTFGDRDVLKGINFYALPNKITTLIGGSGSGKSVTMKHILGLLRPTSGTVRVGNREVAALSNEDLLRMRQGFGMLFQGAALFDSMSVFDNVAFPLREGKNKLPPPEVEHKVNDVLTKLKIPDLAPKIPSQISGGQRKRVGLARAIIAEPEILIYDEPTTGLDPVMTGYVNDMIVEAQELFRVTAIVVSHDMASTFRVSHNIALLHEGRIIAFGSPDELRASPDPRVRQFIFAGAF